MSGRWWAALLAEGLLLTGAIALGAVGATLPPVVRAAASGAVLMGLLAVPTLAALLWGRSRSHAGFLGSVAVAFLGKLLVIALSLTYVMKRTNLEPLAFTLGMMAGWLLGFTLQAVVLLRSRGGVTAG